MRRAAIGGLAVVLMGLGVAGAAPRDDEDTPPKSSAAKKSSSWSFRRLLGLEDKNPPKKQPEKATAKKSDAPAAKAAPPATRLAKKAASDRLKEEEALQRRQAVILRLEEIAMETNDSDLERQIEQLKERVWAQYMERIARLPASKARFEGDERLLDQHLTPDALTGQQALVPSRTEAGIGGTGHMAERKDKR